jgi:hypothetical protein
MNALVLPGDLRAALQPLFEAVPPDAAMPRLTGEHPHHTAVLEPLLKAPLIAGRPDLQAGLWLYVDALERSHQISQGIDTPTGAFWHGIMHRREGDFGNSHYWFRRVGSHPVIDAIEDYDPHVFIDAVAYADPEDAELVARQRREWAALFSWCAREA